MIKLGNKYVEWLCFIFFILSKIRKEGLLSIEPDVDQIKESPIFSVINQTNKENHYLTIHITDILRVMVFGTIKAKLLKEYHLLALEQLQKSINKIDYDLFNICFLALFYFAKGNSPQTSIEFARQAIPIKYKPTFFELEEASKNFVKNFNNHIEQGNAAIDFNTSIDIFLKSIS